MRMDKYQADTNIIIKQHIYNLGDHKDHSRVELARVNNKLQVIEYSRDGIYNNAIKLPYKDDQFEDAERMYYYKKEHQSIKGF